MLTWRERGDGVARLSRSINFHVTLYREGFVVCLGVEQQPMDIWLEFGGKRMLCTLQFAYENSLGNNRI